MEVPIVNIVTDYTSMLLDETVWYLREVAWQFVIAVLAYLLVCIFLYVLLLNVDHRPWQIPGPPARILLVTAHPDDEVMFFGPLVYRTIEQKSCEIHLLCLTMGGNKKRKEELWDCAKILGIPEANVTIIMSDQLPDDASVRWSENVVADIILQHIESYKINAVVTFDKHGVSGHKNHVSIFYAVASLCMENKLPLYCKLYVLESVNILRKYMLLLDLPISILSSSHWYLVSFDQRKKIHKAMIAHKSQYVWFRKLYMKFSRYTMLNTLQEISTLDLELDVELEDD